MGVSRRTKLPRVEFCNVARPSHRVERACADYGVKRELDHWDCNGGFRSSVLICFYAKPLAHLQGGALSSELTATAIRVDTPSRLDDICETAEHDIISHLEMRFSGWRVSYLSLKIGVRMMTAGCRCQNHISDCCLPVI